MTQQEPKRETKVHFAAMPASPSCEAAKVPRSANKSRRSLRRIQSDTSGYPLLANEVPTPLRRNSNGISSPARAVEVLPTITPKLYYTPQRYESDTFWDFLEPHSPPPIPEPPTFVHDEDQPPTSSTTPYALMDDDFDFRNANLKNILASPTCLTMPDEAPFAMLEEEEGFFATWNVHEWWSDLMSCRYKQIIVTTTGMFAGYASMVVLQAKLKSHLNIPQTGEIAADFTFAVSCQYIGNLIFRIAHNFFFACVSSPTRVLIAQGCMLTALSLLIMLFLIEVTNPVLVVGSAYMLSGVAVGSFEGNLISAITPLGKQTKVWAITGIPLGFGFISIVGFILMGLGVPPICLYILTFISNIAGVLVFRFTIPMDQSSHRQMDIIESFQHIREWAPQCGIFWSAFIIDMFFVASFGPVLLYLFNDHNYVPLFSPSAKTYLMNHDFFLAAVNLFTFFGDFFSRSFAYKVPHFDQPGRRRMILAVCMVFSFTGASLVVTKIGLLAPLGMFLIFFGNGMLYASSTRFVDMAVASRFNLVALSTWLLVGDIGSVCGSELIDKLRIFACGDVKYPYVCLSTN